MNIQEAVSNFLGRPLFIFVDMVSFQTLFLTIFKQVVDFYNGFLGNPYF
jgi:hypothetical protein